MAETDRHKWKHHLLLLLALLTGCSKDVVSPVPVQILSASRVILDKDHSERIVYLRNAGGASLDWSVQITAPYLRTSVTEGAVAPGDSIGITLTADFTQTPDQTVSSAQVLFKFPQTFSQSVPVSVVDFTETKWHLPFNITDAKYDRRHDVIIAVSSDSAQLFILNPDERSTKHIPLDFPGTWVSVSPDGMHALIGHNAGISYVDLEGMKVEKTLGLSFDAFDGAVTNGAGSFLFPSNTQWSNIQNVDLTTGDEKSAWNSVYSDSRGKLTSSGNSLIVMTTRLYPPTIDRYEISGGQVNSALSSVWGGDYPMGNYFWLSEDGLTYYANSGSIFSITDNPNGFLSYQTKLQGTGAGMTAFDCSSAANRIYLVSNTTNDFYNPAPGNILSRYDLSNHFLANETLESSVMNDQTGTPAIFDGLGYFAFFNASGSRVHVLQKANNAALQRWGVESFTVK